MPPIARKISANYIPSGNCQSLKVDVQNTDISHPPEFVLTTVRKSTMAACMPPVMVSQAPSYALERVLSSRLIPVVHDQEGTISSTTSRLDA